MLKKNERDENAVRGQGRSVFPLFPKLIDSQPARGIFVIDAGGDFGEAIGRAQMPQMDQICRELILKLMR